MGLGTVVMLLCDLGDQGTSYINNLFIFRGKTMYIDPPQTPHWREPKGVTI